MRANQELFDSMGLCAHGSDTGVDSETGNRNLAKRGIADVHPAPDVWEEYGANPPATFKYGEEKIRGVSLGGWLVSEPFMSPSLYTARDVVDEYTFCRHYGKEAAFDRLWAHWSTFITEADIVQIAKSGLNHIRIPVGYWALEVLEVSDSEPYVGGSMFWLHQAIWWANKHGLRVMIDIHGGPGSQNGFDNSGKRGPLDWPKPANLTRSVTVVSHLAREFTKMSYHGVVTAIQPINEPAGFYGRYIVEAAKEFYLSAYDSVRNHHRPNASSMLYVISDAFNGDDFKHFMRPPTHTRVAVDSHIYSMFERHTIAFSDQQRIEYYCNKRSILSGWHPWTVIGEWTAATTDCGGKLPGIDYRANPDAAGSGSRFDGTYQNWPAVGSCNGKTGNHTNWTQAYKDTLRQSFEVQTSVYEESTIGWIYWNWKMETADDWSYQKGLEGGWIPKIPTEKKFRYPC